MITNFAKGYGVELIDYGRESTGLLIASGSGIMTAVMDHCDCYRYCFDQDTARPGFDLESIVIWADRLCSPVGFVGWFSITDPSPIIKALSRSSHPIIYAGNIEFKLSHGVEARGIGEFIAASNAFSIRKSSTEKSDCAPRNGIGSLNVRGFSSNQQ